jgi:hypothetical protein
LLLAAGEGDEARHEVLVVLLDIHVY